MIRVLLIVLCLATAGCSTPSSTGGWQGPLVDPDGKPIRPPTYEVSP